MGGGGDGVLVPEPKLEPKPRLGVMGEDLGEAIAGGCGALHQQIQARQRRWQPGARPVSPSNICRFTATPTLSLAFLISTGPCHEKILKSAVTWGGILIVGACLIGHMSGRTSRWSNNLRRSWG